MDRTARAADTLRRVKIVQARGWNAWGPWSTGERIFVSTVMSDQEGLDMLGYTRDEALDRIRGELALPDRKAADAWCAAIAKDVGLS